MKKKIRKKVVIFGGNGFIGSNLIRQLNKSRKYQIRIFDKFIGDNSPLIQNCVDDDNCEIFEGDFLNKKDIKDALIGCDYVFHLISMSTPASLYDNLAKDIDLNVQSTINLLEACVEQKIKKFVFVSSGGAIYGDQNNVDKFDENLVVNPISPYAISKITIEKILNYYKKRNNLDFLILRYSNPFGPGQSHRSSVGLVPIFLRKAINGETIEIFGDGSIVRDYIYIDDAIYKTVKLFEKETKYNLYNIASGKGCSINDMIDCIKRNTNISMNVKYIQARSADVNKVILDINRVNSEVRNNDISLDNAIKQTYDWIMENPKY